MRKITLGLALLASSAMAGPALADGTYIKPSATSLAGNNNTVTFDAVGADHLFQLDHRPIQLATIKVEKPDGTAGTVANGLQQRFRSVFDLRLDQDGTWRIFSAQTNVMGTAKIDGQERRVGGRGGPPPGQRPAGQQGGEGRPGGEDRPGGEGGRGQGGPSGPGQGGPGGPGGFGGRVPPLALADLPANATDVHLTEMVSTTETFVTQGAPSSLKPKGKGLEFDPVTHPNAVAMGEPARFRYLIDGQPAAGVKVTVIADGDRYREQTDAQTFTTDKQGLVTITWPKAGLFWVGAEAEDTKPDEKRAEKRRMISAVTLEVMTP